MTAQTLRHGAKGHAVRDLQTALNRFGAGLVVDGDYGDETEAAVRTYQRRMGLVIDGAAGDKTQTHLLYGPGPQRYLAQADLARAAATLGIHIALMQAVNEVESAGSGFEANGKPKILFERHVFHRQLLAHGFTVDEVAALATLQPAILSTQTGGYQGGVAEHPRLARASQIHPAAAIESASWGAFQIMGHHWQRLGYASAEAFATAMRTSEAGQLEAFVRFVKADPALHKALKGKKWAEFAKRYNGPAYARNLYDVKLERAYQHYVECGCGLQVAA
jgi:hypothetical protein